MPEEVIQYRFDIDRDTWMAWKRDIPRTRTLDERIRALIEIDSALAGEADIASLRLLHLKCERIMHRADTARNALDAGNADKAAAELDAIHDLAADLATEG